MRFGAELRRSLLGQTVAVALPEGGDFAVTWLALPSPELGERLEREAVRLDEVRHRSLLRPVGVFEACGRRGWLTEWSRAKTLSSLLRKRRPTNEAALEVLGQLCSALAALHGASEPVPHRWMHAGAVTVEPTRVLLGDVGILGPEWPPMVRRKLPGAPASSRDPLSSDVQGLATLAGLLLEPGQLDRSRRELLQDALSEGAQPTAAELARAFVPGEGAAALEAWVLGHSVPVAPAAFTAWVPAARLQVWSTDPLPRHKPVPPSLPEPRPEPPPLPMLPVPAFTALIVQSLLLPFRPPPQPRYDLVLARLGEQGQRTEEFVMRGPAVVVGSEPGPGGLCLQGIGGLSGRHCVLSVADGVVWVAPTGECQVRLAADPYFELAQFEPISGPARLYDGAVLYLGPLGRGVRLQLCEARALGVAKQHQPTPLASVGVHPAVPVGVASAMVSAGLGLALLLATGVSALLLAFALRPFLERVVPPPGRLVEGEEIYQHAQPLPVAEILDGVERPFFELVVKPSALAAGRPELLDKERWDKRLLAHVAASVTQHAGSNAFYRRLDAVRHDYASVLDAVRREGLPEVVAAVPYGESLYDPRAVSSACAAGVWQLMPEVASRSGVEVRDCSISGQPGLWTPTDLAPPVDAARKARYVQDGRCMIERCRVDRRSDVGASTRASMALLREVWEDPTLRASGSIVPILLMSHNAGYDDARFGAKFARGTNLLPAFRRWAASAPVEPAWFGGEVIRCRESQSEGLCGSVVPAQTQHYAYGIIARHLLAVCYYGANYASEPAFAPFAEHVARGGYCRDPAIIPPTAPGSPPSAP